MRTKALLGLAVLAAGTIAATAQTSVYSLNVVGYYTLTVPAGKYALIANQLVQTNYSVASLLNVPDNTVLYKWGGAGYAVNSYSGGVWDDDTMTLGPGEATFIKAPAGSPINLTFVGEVNQNTNTINLTVGYKMASLFTPQAGLLQTDFGYAPPTTPATSITAVLQWGGAGYATSTYDPSIGAAGAGNWDAEPSVKVGEGFFVKSQTAHTWTRAFKVQ